MIPEPVSVVFVDDGRPSFMFCGSPSVRDIDKVCSINILYTWDKRRENSMTIQRSSGFSLSFKRPLAASEGK